MSGALDAWRYRATKDSSFDRFWQSVVGEAAAQARPALALDLDRAIVSAGEPPGFVATLRDWEDGGRARVAAWIENGPGRTAVPIYPDPTPGELSGRLPAGLAPGEYRLHVAGGSVDADSPFVVVAPDETVGETTPDETGLADAWATAHHGARLSEDRASELNELLSDRLMPALRTASWHPMRSPWWIAAMTTLLGFEWWWRRKRGLL